MPIIDLQRRLVEVGRVRMGKRGDKGQPQKLDTWRLTSRDKERLDAVAEQHGGTVQPWAGREGEFEIVTTTAELPIMLLPGQTLSQWHELWSGGGCQRRCDGEREVLSDGACLCDQEDGDRQCKPTTRLSVMLPDIPGLGCWRLESHGYYAAVELAATAHLLEKATARGQILPARLRIDQRRQVKDGKTTRYAVPVIDIDITMREALPLATAQPVLEHTPLRRELAPVTVEQGMAGAAASAAPKATSGRSAAPIPATGVEFSDTPVPVEGSVGEPSAGEAAPSAAPVAQAGQSEPASPTDVFISDAQRRRLFAIANKHDVDTVGLKAIVKIHTGQESSKAITLDVYEAIVADVEQAVKAPE